MGAGAPPRLPPSVPPRGAPAPPERPGGRAPPPEEPASDEADRTLLGLGVYSAVQTGDTVTIRARGDHPGPGYGARLERVQPESRPPVHRLVVEPPPNPVPGGASAPFSVEATFTAGARVSYVFVVDAGGRHRVPVQQVAR